MRWIIVSAGLLTALACGFLPMVLYAVCVWWFDRYEKEPLPLIVAAFLWGAVPSVIFVLFAELLLSFPLRSLTAPPITGWVEAVWVAPLIEESFKGLALGLLFFFFRHELDSPMDGILYGGLVGFGFAAVENTLYLAGAFIEGGFGTLLTLAVLRGVLFGLNHALFTGVTGLGFALARMVRKVLLRMVSPVVGWILGTVLHAVHNASVMTTTLVGWSCLIAALSDWGGVLILVAVMVWSLLREHHWIVEQLGEEVASGMLPPDRYAVISSYPRRIAERYQALRHGDLRRWLLLGRYYRLATELAFCKQRLIRFPDEEPLRPRVSALREQLRQLDQQLWAGQLSAGDAP